MAQGPQPVSFDTEQGDAGNFLGTGQCTQCSRGYSLDQWFYECFECRLSLCFDCYQIRHSADHIASVVSVRFQEPASSTLPCCRLCWNNSTCCYACDDCNLVVCRGCWHFRFNAKIHQHRFYSVTETPTPAPPQPQYIWHQGHETSLPPAQLRQLEVPSELDKATASFPESPSYIPLTNPSTSNARILDPDLTQTSDVDVLRQIQRLDTQHHAQTGSRRHNLISPTYLADQNTTMERNPDQLHVSHPLYQTVSTPSAAHLPTPSDSTATPGAQEPVHQLLTPELARRVSLPRSHPRSAVASSQRPAKTKHQPSLSGLRMRASGKDSPVSDSGRIIKRPSSRTSNASNHTIQHLRRHSIDALNTPQSSLGVASPHDSSAAVDAQTSSAAPIRPIESSAPTMSPEADLVSAANAAFPFDQAWNTEDAILSPLTTQHTRQQQESDLQTPSAVRPAAPTTSQRNSVYLQLAHAQLQREHAHAQIQAQARVQAMQAAEAAATAAAAAASASAPRTAKSAKKAAPASKPDSHAQISKVAEDKGEQQQRQQQEEQKQQQQQQGNTTLQQRMSLLTSEAQLNWAAIEAFANMPVGL